VRPVLRSASPLTLHTAANQRRWKDTGFMSLAGRQQRCQKLAGAGSPEVDFGAEAALAPPKRFGFGTYFSALAACW